MAAGRPGRRIASASADGTVQLWDLPGNPLGLPLAGDARVADIAFSPDGVRFAAAGDTPTVLAWDTASRAGIDKPPTPNF